MLANACAGACKPAWLYFSNVCCACPQNCQVFTSLLLDKHAFNDMYLRSHSACSKQCFQPVLLDCKGFRSFFANCGFVRAFLHPFCSNLKYIYIGSWKMLTLLLKLKSVFICGKQHHISTSCRMRTHVRNLMFLI